MREAFLGLVLLGACASPAPGPYSPAADAERQTARAEKLSREAADLVYSAPKKAEQRLREALTADLSLGPARNNDLGVLYLEQDELYEAAGELEWARKPMPEHPDSRMSLALTLERAGQTDEAIATYRTALEVYPRHVPTTQALARLRVRAGARDAALEELLTLIAVEGTTDEWRRWAARRLASCR